MTSLNGRRICSHDIVRVPESCYVLNDGEGEMYFCNARCLCLWAVQFVTKAQRSEQDKAVAVEMITSGGEKRRFSHFLDLAQWSAANALFGTENDWINNGLFSFHSFSLAVGRRTIHS